MTRWLLALVLALGAATVVAGQRRDAADTVAGLGTRRLVVVARRDLGPGQTIAADDVVARQLPLLAIPSGALAGDVTGRVVTARIMAGEVVNEARVAPHGLSVLAAMIPPGHRGVALPRPGDGSALDVDVGDRVEVLSPGDSGGLGGAAPADVVAAGAEVIAVADDSVTLVVTDDEAGAVAAALARGTPVLALTGPEG